MKYFNRFLGFDSTTHHNIVEQEKAWVTTKVAQSENGILFDLVSNGNPVQFMPEQVNAVMIDQLQRIVRGNDLEPVDYVFSVPGYYTDKEKQALLDSASIANIKIVKLISEPTAGN